MAFQRKYKPVPGFSRKHPINNPENHEKLLQHILLRLDWAKSQRDALVEKFADVDRTVHGFIKYDEADKARIKDNRAGKGPKPVTVSLPLTAAKLDELTTFLLEVFWPNQGMHSAIAKKEEQPLANGVAQLLNQQAAERQHYRKLARFLGDALKYNLSAAVIEWVEELGLRLKNTPDRRVAVDKDVVTWRGNDIVNIDMYNFLWDPSVNPVDVPQAGEFFAYVERHTAFSMRKLAAAGRLFGVDRFVSRKYATSDNASAQFDGVVGSGAGARFYTAYPTVRDEGGTGGVVNDWFAFASNSAGYGAGDCVELVTTYIWLDPSEFGLSDEKELQIWRVRIANSAFIVDTEMLNNAHNMLPLVVTSPSEDGLGLQQKSAAEMLVDLQRFASFLMNVHQQAARKALWGVTAYDPTAINLDDVKDDVAARIPLLPGGYGKPITDIMRTFNDAPKTESTMVDISRVADMMEGVLPTNILKQVTDLERATNYQAAATVQGANRRSLKMARVIDDQAVKPMKRMMFYNLTQYADVIEVIDDAGQVQSVDMAAVRDMQLEYTIGEGLQGMDKLMTMSVLKDIIMAVIQSQQALQEIDMVALLDYWTSLLGDKTDLSQFRRQQPTPQMQSELASAQVDREARKVDTAMSAAQQIAAMSQGVA